MSQKSQTDGISILEVVVVKRTNLLEKRTFGGIATQKAPDCGTPTMVPGIGTYGKLLEVAYREFNSLYATSRNFSYVPIPGS